MFLAGKTINYEWEYKFIIMAVTNRNAKHCVEAPPPEIRMRMPIALYVSKAVFQWFQRVEGALKGGIWTYESYINDPKVSKSYFFLLLKRGSLKMYYYCWFFSQIIKVPGILWRYLKLLVCGIFHAIRHLVELFGFGRAKKKTSSTNLEQIYFKLSDLWK